MPRDSESRCFFTGALPFDDGDDWPRWLKSEFSEMLSLRFLKWLNNPKYGLLESNVFSEIYYKKN